MVRRKGLTCFESPDKTSAELSWCFGWANFNSTEVIIVLVIQMGSFTIKRYVCHGQPCSRNRLKGKMKYLLLPICWRKSPGQIAHRRTGDVTNKNFSPISLEKKRCLGYEFSSSIVRKGFSFFPLTSYLSDISISTSFHLAPTVFPQLFPSTLFSLPNFFSFSVPSSASFLPSFTISDEWLSICQVHHVLEEPNFISVASELSFSWPPYPNTATNVLYQHFANYTGWGRGRFNFPPPQRLHTHTEVVVGQGQ